MQALLLPSLGISPCQLYLEPGLLLYPGSKILADTWESSFRPPSPSLTHKLSPSPSESIYSLNVIAPPSASQDCRLWSSLLDGSSQLLTALSCLITPQNASSTQWLEVSDKSHRNNHEQRQ